MKILFVLLIGISFLTANDPSGSMIDVGQSIPVECPQCIEDFKKCTAPIHKEFMTTVGKACEEFKEKKISKEEYHKISKEASRLLEKALEPCMTTFNKCCMVETKTKMEENKSA